MTQNNNGTVLEILGGVGHAQVSVKCPGCGGDIRLSNVGGGSPERCESCGYSFVRQSDLMLIANACAAVNPSRPDLLQSASSALRRISALVPEAALAMAKLAGRAAAVPLSADDRFGALQAAYACGSMEAEAQLDKMCRVNPQLYVHSVCPVCGASIFKKAHASAQMCVFCQNDR